MNILLLTSEPLKDYPPIITMVRMLSSMGHKVTCLTFAKDELLASMPEAENIYIYKQPIRFVEKHNKPRIAASIAFRMEKLVKFWCARRIPHVFADRLREADAVWVAHENTFLAGGKYLVDRLPNYIYTMYELPLKLTGMKDIYTYAAQKARVLVSAEYCRAHIMKAIFRRNEVPSIIPNKPASHPRNRMLPIEDPQIAEKIANIEASGRKIIMYMGIISDERPLEPIINAVRNMRDRYEFVVLGGWTRYLDKIMKEYGDSFTYLGSVVPPHHLEIASHAHITYISYVPQQGSINAVFCAPNKVYEFAGFGVPMLCNDVPGLKHTVEAAGMGLCLPSFTETAIEEAICKMEDHYEQMQDAAQRYYDSEDLEEVYLSALDQYRKD